MWIYILSSLCSLFGKNIIILLSWTWIVFIYLLIPAIQSAFYLLSFHDMHKITLRRPEAILDGLFPDEFWIVGRLECCLILFIILYLRFTGGNIIYSSIVWSILSIHASQRKSWYIFKIYSSPLDAVWSLQSFVELGTVYFVWFRSDLIWLALIYFNSIAFNWYSHSRHKKGSCLQSSFGR